MISLEGRVGQPDVSILIVAYNSRDFISDCIGSVIAHTSCSHEILLIDNGCDGTADLVAREFPSVRIVPSRGNIGFGKGNNALASEARGQYLLLLNPDTRLYDAAIDRLLDFARHQPAGAWGGVTTLPDGTFDTGNFLSIPTVPGLLRNAFVGSNVGVRRAELEALSEPERVDVLCGGLMMLSRQTWDRLGGFDESFLLYSEEIDLFARLARMGEQAWITPHCKIIHNVGSGTPHSATRLMFATTGAMHYARRHWQAPLAQIAGLALWLEAARRWGTSTVLGLASRGHRARRKAYDRVVLRPWLWWNGYRGRTSLD
ncbi:glycosyltransferase [Novosphingobium sp. ERN07]|uniref:glycosyltransferase family 2 protein n=1 Tax=Novosphingobium sp. ERN07 TaxID=2726187 RepID=UPI00145671F0|nr:glycosyltransferase family 2 protein [Novosphingobium sp. ERN07]NLR69414.1 glycosyltransferase [Novosphingobium sp. ERN07]